MRKPILLSLLVVTACTPSAQAAPNQAQQAKQAQAQAQAAAPAAVDPLAERAAALAKKHKKDGLTVLVEAPFVVVGDEKPAKVKQRAERTVRWTVTMLKQDFFDHDPADVIEIWIFASEKSYRKGAKKFFGDTPDTPYGYYSPTHKAIVMNVGPGAGTLVHEIVHPFMEANFPGVPAWFNEGLASLYEYPTEVNGHIHGKVNWRLRGLKKELAAGHRRSFKSLTGTTDEEFYGAADDTYAQARYLVYYLQEHGKLVEFYKRFHANVAKDPTGYETLKAVLGRDDAGMKKFQGEWEAWVLALEE